MTKELKPLPCPFCGAEAASLRASVPPFDSKWRIWCLAPGNRCGVIGPYKHTKAEAIAAWNRRADRDAVLEKCAAIADAEFDLAVKTLERCDTAKGAVAYRIAKAIRAIKEKP